MAGLTFRIIVSSIDALEDFLAKINVQLKACRHSTPETLKLYIDLEGQNLSREGTLSLMTVFVLPLNVTYLIDIYTLGSLAFTTSAAAPNDDGSKVTTADQENASNGEDTSPMTLKSLLEDPTVPKYFWDVRNDADALWSHHKVRLAGVIDVQLFENASWRRDKTYLKGLDRCIEKDLNLEPTARQAFAVTKWEVRDMMDTARARETVVRNAGSSTAQSSDIFARRPLDTKIIDYCVGDVVHLPALFDFYDKRINLEWRQKAMEESAKRVEEACSPGYQPNGLSKRFSPWSTEH
ncbi:Ribonuclease H-like domain containing protein [Rhypophila sp. PSN 637]